MNIKEQIKAEIERRRRDVEQQRHARCWGKSYYVMMSELLDIISNLPKEQPSGDLEQAAQEYAVRYDMGTCGEIVIDGFKAGAQWQKEQMLREAVDTTMVEGSLNDPTFVRRKIIIVKED